MFVLRDAQGRKVVVSESRTRGVSSKLSFHAQEGLNLVPVAEAVIAEGSDEKDLAIDEAYANKKFVDAGIDPRVYTFAVADRHGVVHIEMSDRDIHSMFTRLGHQPPKCTVNGQVVSKEFYDKVSTLCEELNFYNWLLNGYMCLIPWNASKDIGRVDIRPMLALELIGMGQTVTPESLDKACAKGETRPRLWPGDAVEVKTRSGVVLGTVTGLGKKVSVLRQDSKKETYPYAAVTRTDKAGYDENALAELDATLAANFAYVLDQSHRIYKAVVKTRETVKFPAFPMPDDNQHMEVVKTNEPTCDCPLCGWPMADFHGDGEFLCCFCRVRGIIAHRDSGTVTLLMLRQPAKNRFCIREAKCCANCGLFHFEYGRQGKRSTGYCGATNQCVQAFNTCVGADGKEGYWFPRTAIEYGKHLTQHVTNLGYGVSDARNTTRRDIRDTVYREEDHAAEKKRAERAKAVYAAAFAKFVEDLGKLSQGRRAAGDDLTDEQKEQVREHFRQVLNDGC